ncbi:chaperonin 10-like protein [Lipomyces doorenjongii]
MGGPKTHKAAVLYGAQDIRIEDVPTTDPLPHEVQIAPRATGICGTDLHYYQNGRNGAFVVEEPLVLGHEAAGEVIALGADAAKTTDIKVGDRVAIEPQWPCSACVLCRKGKYNLCQNLMFSGSASSKPPMQGSLQQAYNHPAAFVYRLPDNVGFAEGAMVEPLSVAIHSVRRSAIEAGQSVLVTGAGAIGLFCAAVARISGAAVVTMIDIDQSRLDFAERHGYADRTMIIPLGGNAGESKADFATRMANESLEREGWSAADISFECTGVEVCANICINSAAPGGKVVIVGMGAPQQSLSVFTAARKEVDILNVWRYANTFEAAIKLVSTGGLNIKPLITHTFRLENAGQCLKTVMERPPGLVKSVIVSE